MQKKSSLDGKYLNRLRKVTLQTVQPRAGLTLIELMVGVVVGTVAVAGALEAFRFVEQQSANQIRRSQEVESFGSDFYSAYESVASETLPISSDTAQPLLPLGWGVDTSANRANRNRVRSYCGLAANSFVEDSATGLWEFSFQSGDSATVGSSAFGCPTTAQWTSYGTTLTSNPNTSNSTTPILNFALRGIGKLCTASRISDRPTPSGTWRVDDNSCLRNNSGSIEIDTDTRVAFPLLTAIKFSSEPNQDYTTVGSIFHSISRTEEELATFCSIKRALRQPDFTLSIGSETTQIPNATVTVGTAFRADQDILVLSSGVPSFTDAGFSSAAITADGLAICDVTTQTRYGIATNLAGDEVHKYCNIPVVDGSGGPAQVDARYNASTGFMLINVDGSGATQQEWSRIFDDVAYVNRFELDEDDTTVPASVDRELSFSLGDLPTRRVNGVNHYYRFVPCATFPTNDGADEHCIGWQEAFDTVTDEDAPLTHLGVLPGYLTTITSEEENFFVADRSRVAVGTTETFAAGWLGGRDSIQMQSDLCPEITQPDACTEGANITGNDRYTWTLKTNHPNPGDVAATRPGTPEARTCRRNNDFWYWAGGPEACQLFWFGRQGWGQPITNDGMVTTDNVSYSTGDVPVTSPLYANPRDSSDWNCESNSVQEGIPSIANDATFGTSTNYYVGLYLKETVWGNGADATICPGATRDPANEQCIGEAFRRTPNTRYAAWSAGSTNSCAINGVVGEPNGDGDGRNSAGHFLQMTGLPSGRGIWNDLAAPPQAPLNRSWYNIKGYFVEFDDSAQGDDFIPTRTEVVNIARVMALCDTGPSGLGFEYDWID